MARVSKEQRMILDERNEKIRALRMEQGWKLKSIGDLYGITRERVRQIVGNTGWISHEMRNENIANESPWMTNSELAMKYNMSRKTVGSCRDGLYLHEKGKRQVGSMWRLRVADTLRAMGHDIKEASGHCSFDMTLDDRHNIKVLSSSTHIPKSQVGKLKSPRTNFNIYMHSREDHPDFYILVVIPDGDMFVVPHNEVPDDKINIQFCWPTLRPEIGKYQKYHNRWDLLSA